MDAVVAIVASRRSRLGQILSTELVDVCAGLHGEDHLGEYCDRHLRSSVQTYERVTISTVAMRRSHGHTAVTNDSNQTDGNFLFAGRLGPLRGAKGPSYTAVARPVRALRRRRHSADCMSSSQHVNAADTASHPGRRRLHSSARSSASSMRYFNLVSPFSRLTCRIANTALGLVPDRVCARCACHPLLLLPSPVHTDAAHALCASAIQARDTVTRAPRVFSTATRTYLNALATAEMAVIALHRFVSRWCTS